MPRTTLEQLRLPIALVLLVIAGFLFFPRGGAPSPASGDATPSASVIVGELEGEVLPTDEVSDAPAASEAATTEPTPDPTPEPTPQPTPEPTPAPTPAPATGGGGFQVAACRSISGSTCNGPLGTLPAGANQFTALVTFRAANAGDTLNVILTGPAGTIPGGAYTLQGSGRGYYYSTFQAGNLPGGTYTLTATRNGAEVAVTTFSKAGG